MNGEGKFLIQGTEADVEIPKNSFSESVWQNAMSL